MAEAVTGHERYTEALPNIDFRHLTGRQQLDQEYELTVVGQLLFRLEQFEAYIIADAYPCL